MTEPGESTQSSTTNDASMADELARLRIELWAARDAAIGAIAEAGTLRARNVELEQTIHALRSELARIDNVENSITYRVGAKMLKPAKLARKLAK